MKRFFIVILSLMFCFSLVGCNKMGADEHISTYKMDIIYDDVDKCLNVKESIDYFNIYDESFDYLCFHLYPNAFRENSKQSVVSLSNTNIAYPNGKSYGHIEIKNVMVGTKQAEFSIGGVDENILTVNLNEKLYPNEKVLIEIEFDVFLPNINHRFGYGENTINIANFYPIACVFENGEFMTSPYHHNGDPFYSKISNYEVSLTFDSSLKLASSGEIVSLKSENGKNIAKMKAENVRDFAMVLSDKFEVISKTVGDTKVMYYYYNDEQSQKSLETSCLALETFSGAFGKYPYKTLSVVESNFVHGGMEYPTLVYISDSLSDYETYTNVIVHEIAHQWWYGVVGSNAFANGWQDEGLTDFSTALFYEKNPQYLATYDNVMLNGVKSYTFFVDVYTSVYKTLDTSMTRPLDEYPTEPEYVYIAYTKSMLMFDSIRSIMGDDDFFKALKLYFETYSFKEATPQEMIACFEKYDKVEGVFNSWLNGDIIIVS